MFKTTNKKKNAYSRDELTLFFFYLSIFISAKRIFFYSSDKRLLKHIFLRTKIFLKNTRT